MKADGGYADHKILSGLNLITRNTHDIWVLHVQERVELDAPFDPTFENEIELEAGSIITYDYLLAAYNSDKRRKFYWGSYINVGEYYTGHQLRLGGDFRYRIQPHGSIALNYDLARFVLPNPFKPAYLVYLAPRIEYAFSRRVFFSSVIQYQSQTDNFNYYVRFQWRYRPLSDIYVVYSGNMNTEEHSFTFTNNGMVIKALFWF